MEELSWPEFSLFWILGFPLVRLVLGGPVDGVGEHLLEVFVLKILRDTERGIKRAASLLRVHPRDHLLVRADVALLQNRRAFGQRAGLVEFAGGKHLHPAQHRMVLH